MRKFWHDWPPQLVNAVNTHGYHMDITVIIVECTDAMVNCPHAVADCSGSKETKRSVKCNMRRIAE